MQRKPILLTVDTNEILTDNMRRLTLIGDDLASYPDVSPGSYIKFLFDFDGNPVTTPETDREQTQMRTYTIRALDKANKTLTVDMALHGEGGHSGPASDWARRAASGEQILVGGPGSTKDLPETFDWVIFAGDMTSLPAIASHLENLPAATQGYAVLNITSENDKQTLRKPDGVEIIWTTDEKVSALSDTVAALEWLPGEPAAWVACEFSAMRQMRALLRNEKQVTHQSLYISSYWRQGRSEDQHKLDKRKDQQDWEARSNEGSN
ncbi:siderophore-interacting protein [Alteromonas pelagimontana]|uniref:Siderophore-interacting protein n=1 Tax=Alteromonas pelagimontana TaxID=1858656 RepID=A0A6M4MDL4_9ALTE|nr:siderophore-interacting protein [Alteromonas pelagimontana]QJR80675.1 siderophore-interacting protein [Alteromonas pelagimontana]